MPTIPQVVRELERTFAAGEPRAVLMVTDPDICTGHHSGETLEVDGQPLVAHSIRVWCDLAERLRARLLVPEKLAGGRARLTFERLDERHQGLGASSDPCKYDPGRPFSRIHKDEDPSFVLDLRDALQRIAPKREARVLDLGAHTGSEVVLMAALHPSLRSAHFVCVDRNRAALTVAEERLTALDASFVHAELNTLPERDLGTFDLVVSISTLQSPSVDDRELLRHLVQQRLRPGASLILGLPNCTYVDGETLYGAKVRNFRQPELGPLVKELAFYRRYLQQHRFRVFVTGKHDILVTAAPI